MSLAGRDLAPTSGLDWHVHTRTGRWVWGAAYPHDGCDLCLAYQAWLDTRDDAPAESPARRSVSIGGRIYKI